MAFYIQSRSGGLVIDHNVSISGAPAPRLFANTKNASSDSQLWTFQPFMPNTIFTLLQHPSTDGLVIDIHAELPHSSDPRRPLDAFRMKSTHQENQLWVFYPTGPGVLPETYYFIQSAHFPNPGDTTNNLAIEIDAVDPLAFPQMALQAVAPKVANNQLWIFVDSVSGLPLDPSAIPAQPPF
jgi:hypothetical protein